MTITLRPRQALMIEQARKKLREKVKRLLLQAPCGFGKTILGSYIIASGLEKGRRVMFLTHRDELAKQASRTMRQFGVDHGWIYAAYSPAAHKLVQIAMVDTLRNRIERVQRPDILIIDECHHAVSKTWSMIIERYHSQGTVIIGLSATPERLDGRPLNDMFDDMVLGPTVKELIAEGNLADYSYFAPPQVADLSGLKKKFGDFDQKEQGERMDTPKVHGDAIEHYRKIMPGKRAIAFHVNIKGSMHFVEQCNAAGIPALHVDGEMTSGERAAAIKSFEAGETLILSNVSLFGEGFDVKACDGVILLRRTASLSLFIQMCGRAMRPHESKERAFILDHVGNIAIHGLPDNDHDWSLEGKKKGKGKARDVEEVVRYAQCTHCYHVHEPAPACPKCGFVYQIKVRGDMEKVDGELKEITKEMKQAIQKTNRIAQASATTVDDMVNKLGYSRHRALAVLKARGEKRELRESLIVDLQKWAIKTGLTPLQEFGHAMSDLRLMKPAQLKELREKLDAYQYQPAGESFALEQTAAQR